jgi:hypothetical protein
MAFYMITSAHEPEQCLDALDEMLAKGSGSLDKFVFGCKEGDHTGYAIVEAENRSAALNVLPDMMQETACVAKVDRFTPAEIKSFHEKAA